MRVTMDKDLRNRISENKILTYSERAKIISDLESYEELRSKIDEAIEEIESAKRWRDIGRGIPRSFASDKDFDLGLETALDILKKI